MVPTLGCNVCWEWGYCAALWWGEGRQECGHLCVQIYSFYTLKGLLLSFSISWITGQRWQLTRRQNIMTTSIPLCCDRLQLQGEWIGKHWQDRKYRHSPRGCFLILSLHWTLGNPTFSKCQFQHATYSSIWSWSAVYLNWDVVLKKRTIIVILSIWKLKNVPAEFQGLRLEVQLAPSWCC